MAYTDVQGKDVPLLLSDDNWTTAYTVVCLVSGGLKQGFPVNTEESQCGSHTGVGSFAFSQQFSAIVNTTPATVTGGAGEASYKKLQSWCQARTLIRFKVQNGASGVNFYHEGQVYLNDLTLDWQVGQIAKVNGTLTGTGDFDNTF